MSDTENCDINRQSVTPSIQSSSKRLHDEDQLNSTLSDQSAKRVRKKENGSVVWYAFKTVNTKHKCQLCPYSCPVDQDRGNTSTMLKHLRDKHGKQLAILDALKLAKQLNDESAKVIFKDINTIDKHFKTLKKAEETYDTQTFHDLLLNFLITTKQSFELAENVHLRKLLVYLEANVQKELKGADTLKKMCMKKFIEMKVEVSTKFKQIDCKYSITSDIWSSNNQHPFMAVTFHYIDKDWQLQSCLAGFKHFPGRHGGEDICNVYIQIADEMLPPNDQLLCMTLDNASNNGTFVSSFCQKNPGFNPSEMRIPCLAHVLHLACSDALANIVDNVVAFRDLAKLIKKSNVESQILRDLCRIHNVTYVTISLDVKTRWNSTYDMLKCVLKMRPAIDEYLQQQQDVVIDWDVINRIQKFLKVFKVITADQNQCSLMSKELDLCSCSEKILCKAARDAYFKIKKYFNGSMSMTFKIATCLDPRYKTRFFAEFYDESEKQRMEQVLGTLFARYYAKYGKQDFPLISTSLTADIDSDDDAISAVPDMGPKSDMAKQQLMNYLSEQNSSRSVDPLKYWATYQSLYPVVAKLARDYLAVPAASVASEVEFSQGGLVVDKKRHRLAPTTIEALTATSSWVNTSSLRGSLFADVLPSIECDLDNGSTE
ncbi:hypothetical protein MP228_005523 [Amoeboaphelidium protococcarum]|nr:hypothetical protein MP228_005523 [Amoeboaphelidium protococcarum]